MRHWVFDNYGTFQVNFSLCA